jgi:hypothetical protein
MPPSFHFITPLPLPLRFARAFFLSIDAELAIIAYFHYAAAADAIISIRCC